MHTVPGLAIAALLLSAATAEARGEIIDRVLAVVDGQIITLSDVRGVERLGLIVADDGGDPIAAVLERLIDRRLMLTESGRYGPPEPSAAAVDAALAEVQSRFADALAFEIALNQTAMSHEDLRRYAADTLRVEAYLQQRFGTAVEPSGDELLRHYQEHLESFRREGAIPPFAAVREEIRTRLVDERRGVLVRDWLEGLRRRASLVVLYLPPITAG